MSSLDWPPEFERTSVHERERNNSYQASLGQTTKEIATEMDRLDPTNWRASTASGGSHVKSSGLPKHSANPDDPGFVLRWSMDGEQFAVACDAFTRLRDNARTVYLWVHETRMRGQRPVTTGESEFAAARLPAGDDVVEVTAEPHEILGVPSDASPEEINDAFRERVKQTHPDREGGSQEAFDRVQRARKAMLGRNA